MTSFIYVKYRNIKEQRDIERAVNIFETAIHKYSSLAIGNKKLYDFEINYSEKSLKVFTAKKSVTGVELVEEYELPEKLKYATPYDNKCKEDIDVYATLNGNLSHAFSVYIFDYSGLAKYRVAFYTFNQNKLIKINLYKNINAGKIRYEDILQYHKSEEKVGAGWKREY